jgi:hypothetical protein
MIRAALIATLALPGLDWIERQLLGHAPAYDIARMGRRLFGSARAGKALRWVYGPAMAVAQRTLRIPPLLFGPLVAAGELFAMPRTGATPPPRRWRRGEVPMLFAHATAFSLIAAV